MIHTYVLYILLSAYHILSALNIMYYINIRNIDFRVVENINTDLRITLTELLSK